MVNFYDRNMGSILIITAMMASRYTWASMETTQNLWIGTQKKYKFAIAEYYMKVGAIKFYAL